MHQQQQQAQTDLRRPITSFSDLSQSNPPQQSQPAQNIFSVQIPPMDKQNFETTFKNFCVNKGLKPAGLMIEHRPVDIHALHTCVMQEGGFQKVQQAGLWDVIAGRLGFVQFPGSGTQPPKSGPGVAQSLANIYTDYLVVFERMYVENVIVSGRKMLGQPGGTGPQTPHLQANQQPNQQRPAFNARQMELLMSPTAQEFRSRGVSKKVTQVAESQRAAHDQTQSIVVPTQEQLQQALIFINKFRSEFIANNLPKLGPADVPLELRTEYSAIVEQIHRHSQETGDKLPLYCAMLKRETMMRRVMTIMLTAEHQRNLLSTGAPRFVVNIVVLRNMLQTIVSVRDGYNDMSRRLALHLHQDIQQQQ